jgi:hypothetical protein
VKPEEVLDSQERRCLLRAARAHMLKLLDDYNRLEGIAASSTMARAAADSAAQELACLQRGITWLWRTQTP